MISCLALEETIPESIALWTDPLKVSLSGILKEWCQPALEALLPEVDCTGPSFSVQEVIAYAFN